MKEIKLFIKCSYKSETGKGEYTGVLEYNGKTKEIVKKDIISISSNRIMLEGIVDLVNMVKEPCKIEVHTMGMWGATKVVNKDGTPKVGITNSKHNSDLKNELRQILINNGHILIPIIDDKVNKRVVKVTEFNDEDTILTIMDRVQENYLISDDSTIPKISLKQISYIKNLYFMNYKVRIDKCIEERLNNINIKGAELVIGFLEYNINKKSNHTTSF